MFDKIKLEEKYDVIIIGAGIGGLVCGCYLAKAGLKTLIVEQHDKAGGCCSSFVRKGIRFDAGVHSLGSCREDGVLGIILDELGLRERLKLCKNDTIDRIFSDNYNVLIRRNVQETIDIFSDSFPREAKNIRDFFNFINSFRNSGTIYYRFYKQLIHKKFADVLRIYFKNSELITLFNILLLNTGVPSSEISALSAIMLYREFILDGGYYPLGGMQSFSNILAQKFIELGGNILLSRKVKKIVILNNQLKGVLIKNNNYIHSKYIVSDCDARETFFELIGKEYLETEFINAIDQLLPTPSLFTVYLGINKSYISDRDTINNLWNFPSSSNFSKNFLNIFHNKEPYFREGVCCFVHNFNTQNHQGIKNLIYLLVNANYMDENYWTLNKQRVGEEIIKRAENIMPGLSSSIIIKELSNPIDIAKFTLNYKGAANGWMYTPLQISSNIVKIKSKPNHLYMTGHWINQPLPGGITSVAFLGKKTAKLVEAQENLKS